MTTSLPPGCTPAFALDAVLDAAGAHLLGYLGKVGVRTKSSDIDLVTEADQSTEELIVRMLRSTFPDHGILAEESGASYPAGKWDHRWVIDPLDGTTNFAHGVPQFGVSIAFESGGKILSGGVFNPVSGEKFLAQRGEGAFLAGSRLRVSSASTLAGALLVSGFPYDRRARIDHYLNLWKEFLLEAHGVMRLGSAALDLCFVAAGRLDGFWEEKLSAWDTAAGLLIVEEAGGTVTDYHGAPYRLGGPSILATNGNLHPRCIEVLGRSRVG